MDPNLNTEEIVKKLQKLTEDNEMPEWLKQNILLMAANINIIAPPEEAEIEAPVFIYFH